MVYVILAAVPILDVLWFFWALRRVRGLPRAKVLRVVIAVFFIAMFGHYFWLLLNRGLHMGIGAPALTLGMAYVWHLILLPMLMMLILIGEALAGVTRYYKKRKAPKASKAQQDADPSEDGPATGSKLSRRDFLLTSAIIVPPALTVVAGVGGYIQCHNFRMTRMDVELPSLPLELDGLTIAHLSDVHAGRFTDEKMLAKIAKATNDLRADMIVMTGDLIDYSLSVLPSALDYMARLDAPLGVYLCEGNHDLFESRIEFEQQVRKSGLEILINQTRDLKISGHDVQLHGLRWGSAEGSPHGFRRDGGASVNLDQMKPQMNPDAFSILLAHHPHAFDPAAAMGIPLTLSGHTHGGQLMLTKTVGAGSLMFDYWSGLYRRETARLVVSNGAGNWFPVRINAPAEISLLTLRSVALA